MGGAAATLIALALGVAVLVSGGDGDSPAILGLRAASPTATTTPPSTPSLTPTATASPHPPAASEKTPTSPAPYAPARAAPAPAAPKPAPTPAPAPAPTPTPVPPGSDAVLVGAGDIAGSGPGAEATAKLLDGIAGTVFTAGDNAYEDGTDSQFANYYNPTWGRHKGRTLPAAGNHDYATGGATGYYNYFGAAAGDPSKGYYSYNLGAWHVVVLNSNVSRGAGSPQETWLRADLAAHPTACTAAIWHHPLFSSGEHGNNPSVKPLFKALYDYHADVVLNGHDHTYERFAPQDASGVATAQGIREFVVGMGGRSHYSWGSVKPNSEVRDNTAYGVIKLTLHPNSYDWNFIPEAGKAFTDSGSQACH